MCSVYCRNVQISVTIDSVHDMKQYLKACEHFKASAIRIKNPEILPNVYYAFEHWFYKGKTLMVYDGDIFQVEGFEYEVAQDFEHMCITRCVNCKFHDLSCNRL